MTDKKEFEKVFNELLGTDIKWSKLPKENLIELATLFKRPDIFLKRLTEGTEAGVMLGISEMLLTAVDHWDGPIVNSMRRLLLGREG